MCVCLETYREAERVPLTLTAGWEGAVVAPAVIDATNERRDQSSVLGAAESRPSTAGSTRSCDALLHNVCAFDLVRSKMNDLSVVNFI